MTDAVENQEVVNTPAEPTPNEIEARSAGWVPKEEYTGDENKWVDADEFVRRGPLFEKINVQSRELKEVKKALDALKAHHASVKETAYKEALADLRKQKKEALIDGDADKLIEIDEQADAIREEARKFEQSRKEEITREVQAEVHPEFQAWTNRNPWYNTSAPMKAFADALGIELRATGLSPSEVLKKVELKIKEEFPQKFRNPNRDKPGAVESTGKGSGKSHNDGSDNLTDMERNVMNRFVRQGVMTAEQYKAELKKSKETK